MKGYQKYHLADVRTEERSLKVLSETFKHDPQDRQLVSFSLLSSLLAP